MLNSFAVMRIISPALRHAVIAVTVIALSACTRDAATEDTTQLASKALIGAPNTATLSWTIPNRREDGATLPLSELKGYEIRVQSSTGGHEVIRLNDPDIVRHTVSGLLPGEYEFSVRVIDHKGVYSKPSNIARKVID